VMWRSTMLAVAAEGGGDMADVEAMRTPSLHMGAREGQRRHTQGKWGRCTFHEGKGKRHGSVEAVNFEMSLKLC
jgi:hypothetical protein